MKNLQNIVLGILSVAVLFLLYKQLFTSTVEETSSGNSKPAAEKKISLVPDSTNAFGAVAFVNTDTLLEKFESFKAMRAAFERRSSQAENELGGRMRALESEYMEVQKKIQAGTMTETLIKDAEQTLMRKQQELAMLREQKTGQLMEDEKGLTKKLNDQIFDYMQDYAPAHGLKYVLGYTRGGGILYAADSLDITDAVLQGLNEKYKGK
jgi:outer membrane protein